MTDDYVITVNEILTHEDVQDMFITGIEQGIGYWANLMTYKPDEVYARIVEREGDEAIWTVDAETILKGVKLFVKDQQELIGHFNFRDWLENSPDANDCDVIIQLGIFGELTYS